MKTQKCENDQVSFHCGPAEAIQVPLAKRLSLMDMLDNLLIFEGY